MAYMMKAGWALISNQNALWVQVIRNKYKCRDDQIPQVIEKRSSSNFWRGLCKTWEHVLNNLIWRVGTGDKVDFWRDSWLPSIGPLLHVAHRDVPPHIWGIKLPALVNDNGDWVLDQVANYLPPYVQRMILGMLPPRGTNGPDSLAWGPTNDGEFSISSAYYTVTSYTPSPQHPIFKIIWRWPGPERIKFLLWRVTRGAILTNDARRRRGLTTNPTCPRCGSEPETALHFARDCPFAKAVWHELRGTPLTDPFFLNNFLLWMQDNLGTGRGHQD